MKNYKYWASVFAIMMILDLMGTAVLAAEESIIVTVNGKVVTFPDQKPYMENERVMIPVRFVSEALGAKVTWDKKSKTAGIVRSGKNIKMKIGSNRPTVNGKATKNALDVPARMVKNRTIVPLRFVSEALGGDVEWVSATNTVVIKDAKAPVQAAVPQGYYTAQGYILPKVFACDDISPTSEEYVTQAHYPELAMSVDVVKPVEPQFAEVRAVIASKFGDQVAGDVDQIMREAERIFHGTVANPGKLTDKSVKANGRIIRVYTMDGSSLIDIRIWRGSIPPGAYRK